MLALCILHKSHITPDLLTTSFIGFLVFSAILLESTSESLANVYALTDSKIQQSVKF